jgi:hypothetical protein
MASALLSLRAPAAPADQPCSAVIATTAGNQTSKSISASKHRSQTPKRNTTPSDNNDDGASSSASDLSSRICIRHECPGVQRYLQERSHEDKPPDTQTDASLAASSQEDSLGMTLSQDIDVSQRANAMAECVICQDSLTDETVTFLVDCVHHFHKECLLTWSNVTNTCPVCKTPFEHMYTVDLSSGSVMRRPNAYGCTYTKVLTRDAVAPKTQQHVYTQEDVAMFGYTFAELESTCSVCRRDTSEDLLVLCDGLHGSAVRSRG